MANTKIAVTSAAIKAATNQDEFWLELEKLEAHSFNMAVGDKRPGARYAVKVNGEVIGEVEKHSEQSYRSDSTTSRLRYGFRGYRVYWAAEASRTWHAGLVHHVGYKFDDRGRAVTRLVEEYLAAKGGK